MDEKNENMSKSTVPDMQPNILTPEKIDALEHSETVEETDAQKTAWWREIRLWLIYIVISVAMVFFINSYIACLVRVQGESMEPTLHSGDLLVVSRLSAPHDGDIVVFPYQGTNLVKRCIATGGETVVLDYVTNAVFVDNKLLDEPYINLGADDPMEEKGETAFIVPEGYIFVLGDNRNHSNDSRGNIGFVPVDEVIGKTIVCIPIGRWFS